MSRRCDAWVRFNEFERERRLVRWNVVNCVDGHLGCLAGLACSGFSGMRIFKTMDRKMGCCAVIQSSWVAELGVR